MKNLIIVSVLLIFLFGCGNESKRELSFSAPHTESKGFSEATISSGQTSSVQKRMIIKNANLYIEVEDYNTAFKKVNEIVTANNGFITNTNSNKDDNDAQSGNINIEIPAEKLDLVMDAIKQKIGQVTSESVTTEDVTESYIDTKARLENKKKAEQQYQALFEKARTVDEILKVEAALAEVRSEIESAESKIKYYEAQSSMSSILLYLFEPNSEGGPEGLNFITVIKNSFRTGINGMILMVGVIIVVVITLIPLLPIVYFSWKGIRKWYQKRKAKKEN
ncbi:MAG: DUF4349 domain-containing protein [bacterium]